MTSVSRAPAPPPGLPRILIAVMLLTIAIGLPVDKLGGIPGQLVVSVWTWGVFLVLLSRINPQLRLALMLCLVVSTIGECGLSLVWKVYGYWLHNVPFFVPPGHVLLFALGLTFAPRMPNWTLVAVTAGALAYGGFAYATATDTVSVPLAILFLVYMVFGSNRRLYATMFLLALVMELYGTWIGNWKWAASVPGLSLTCANPPILVGALYCGLDLFVVNCDRLLRKWRKRGAAVQAGMPA